MRRQTQHLRLDERRAVAAAGALHGLARDPVAGDGVAPVDDHAGNAVSLGAIGDVLGWHLLLPRHADREPVVLDEEDHRELVDGREVQRLVEVAFAGAALADRREGDRVLAAHPRRQRDARGVDAAACPTGEPVLMMFSRRQP